MDQRGAVTIRNPLLALDIRTNLNRRLTELQQAWERYLTGRDPTTARPLVAESWERSRKAGVKPTLTGAPTRMETGDLRSYWNEHPLNPVFEPVLGELRGLVADSGHLLVITDARGMILHLEGDRTTRRRAEAMNFVPGADWSEAAAGTNAIGTALAVDQPLQVLAAEHFCEVVHPWTCSAAVIHDPLTQEVLGVIDVTGLRKSVHPHSLAAVMAAARAAQEHLRERQRVLEHLLHQEYLKESQREGHGLAALDPTGRAVIFSPWLAQQRLLDPRGHLVCLPPVLVPERSGAELELEATGPRGQRLKLTIRTVWQGQRLAGYIVRVYPQLRVPGAPVAPARYTFATIQGQSPGFRAAVERAQQAAEHDLPVLLLGESGTGKEVLAQAVHVASRRRAGPFVAVNCAAIPSELLASELFGYEGGAFTGARREGHRGKFEQAQGGTLFLDEIGDMPLESQALLLRVLEERMLVRVGGAQAVPLDVRVIAATNANLEERILAGRFRSDLYYRISVWPILLPPLRERPGDIEVLFPALLRAARDQLGRLPLDVDPDALALLTAYPWPGNVRELKNLAFRLALEVEGPVVRREHLPPYLAFNPPAQLSPPAISGFPPVLTSQPAPGYTSQDPTGLSSPPTAPGGLRAAERDLMLRTLEACGGNVAEAARRLGIHRSTIYRRLRQELGSGKGTQAPGLQR